ncbi:LPS export ABC transporter periplasmic protein LptC [Pannus brasiliensis CCIBt3594]|uniref:LPS export ABC transporter periplasmic protein LptC n=1 Tax=Pannus brasiliensis CCIBt3594 TaxID=1427578 RepID=A0AAW9QQZ7_9CHRO
MQNPRPGKNALIAPILLCLLGIGGCQPPDPPKISPAETPKIQDNSRLTLNNATLEQANPTGQSLWKIQVKKATYSQDQKIAQLESVKGNIYQDGKVVLQVSADRGQVYKEGQEILLEDNIVAIDPRNQAVIRAKEVRWQPKEGLLIVRRDLKGSHRQVEAIATEGRYDTRREKLELVGNIVATAKEPRVRLTTDRLTWEIPKKLLSTDRPMTFDRYEKNEAIDRLSATGGSWELDNRRVILRDKIEYRSIDPPLQIAGQQAIWNYRERTISSDRPAELFQYEENVSITGNRVFVDLNGRIARLQDGVNGQNRSTGAKLYSQTLTWKMAEKTVEADGNVVYDQPEPKFNVTGDTAVGRLVDNNIVVSSRSRDRVVTEIYPR